MALEGICFTADIFWEDFASNISYVTLNVILSQRHAWLKKKTLCNDLLLFLEMVKGGENTTSLTDHDSLLKTKPSEMEHI